MLPWRNLSTFSFATLLFCFLVPSALRRPHPKLRSEPPSNIFHIAEDEITCHPKFWSSENDRRGLFQSCPPKSSAELVFLSRQTKQPHSIFNVPSQVGHFPIIYLLVFVLLGRPLIQNGKKLRVFKIPSRSRLFEGVQPRLETLNRALSCPWQAH
ncbi:hypothetical protein N431DRAFT_104859 [Stipitochalara longipes BDJ]|nr:hypothetical protein N431DRAFT_104859 [Stipitochalara longipes BDJ]